MKSYIPILLEEILGSVRKHSEHSGQISFDCPECDNGRGKGNLEINYSRNVFKCWSCGETNHMHGSLYWLIKKYGTESNLDTYQLLKPTSDYFKRIDVVDDRELVLPASWLPLSNDISEPAMKIKYYLYSRGVTDYMISKFRIHYSLTPGFKGRFFVPTYDQDNKIEYYVGRAIYEFLSPKYKNADLDKFSFIMFEHLIDWESDIYIVEGVMDAMVIPNAIPILGKVISPLLLHKLRTKAKANIIICMDGDAQDDAKQICSNLNILELQNRIRNIELTGEWDLSKINEKYGRTALIKTLRHAKKFIE